MNYLREFTDWITQKEETQSNSKLSSVSTSSILRRKLEVENKGRKLKLIRDSKLEQQELEHRIMKLKLDREIIENDRELEQVLIEEQCLDENIINEETLINKFKPEPFHQTKCKNYISEPVDNSIRLPSTVAAHSKVTKAVDTNVQPKEDMNGKAYLEHLLGKLLHYSGLPKIDLVKFNGDPLAYTKFIHNFQVNIDSRQIDNNTKFQYLLTHCTEKAAKCIEPYIYYDPDQGYELALKALKERFGVKHVVARAHLQGLVDGPNIKNGEIDKIEDLVADMIACEIVLKGMNMDSQLNNCENMLKIFNRLPFEIKSKWVDRAYNITELWGREANFNELCQFMSSYIKKFKTLFGNELLREIQDKSERCRQHTVRATQSDQKKCICCDLV